MESIVIAKSLTDRRRTRLIPYKAPYLELREGDLALNQSNGIVEIVETFEMPSNDLTRFIELIYCDRITRLKASLKSIKYDDEDK